MRIHSFLASGVMIAVMLAMPHAVAADGDAEAGAGVFQVCGACHSLELGRHLTGPSLAAIWDISRRA